MIDAFELEGLEAVSTTMDGGEVYYNEDIGDYALGDILLDGAELGPRTTAAVETYPIQKYNNGLIHYDYSVAQNQMELAGNRYSYFATPLYSNSSGLVGFGIATGEGRLDYVIDKGKFNDFTRNIDSYYLAADWGSTMTQDHIAYFEAIKNGDWGTAWSSGKNIVGAEYTFANLLSSASTIGGVSGATRGLTRNSVRGTTVFRAVDATEEAIIKNTRKFSLQEGGVESKYFAKSLEDAHWYGQRLYPNGYSIIQATVKRPINAKSYWFEHVDIGAYVFPKQTLPYIVPR